MKFRLKLLWFEIAIETPAPEQVSTVDIVSAIFSAMSAGSAMDAYADAETGDDAGE